MQTPLNRPKILIVEDETIVARDIRQQLSEIGYDTVGHATRGSQAIAMVETLKPDLVLMDIQLAGDMDGVVAAQAIRDTYFLPVVFLTAFAADDTLSRAKLTEPFGYILKPFSERELRTVLEMALYKHKTEVRLRASEQRFRSIFDFGPECLMVVGPECTLLEINRQGLSFLEIDSLDEAASYGLINFVGPEHRTRFEMFIQSVFEGQVGFLEFEVTGMRGTRRWLETHATPMYHPTGKVIGVLGQTRDITERKQVRQQRRVSDHILDAVYQGVLITEPDGKILYANKAFTAMTGYADAEIKGRDCRFLQGTDTDPATIASIRQALIALRPITCDILNYRKDGTPFWNGLSISPVLDERGKLIRYIGLANDISERKDTEVAMRESAFQLKTLSKRVLEVQEAERRRVAIELHDELGQSLTAIKINLQARERFGQQTQQEVNAENIRIVDDALQQVRRLALALRPSMLDDLGLSPALRWLCDQTAARGNIQIEFSADMPPGRLAPDTETACYRIVQEALTNILRHAEASSVTVMLSLHHGELRLIVIDNGRGFDSKEVRARARSGGSIGMLGMLGMQERATLVGGSLTVQTEPGEGCVVTLSCPIGPEVALS